MKIDFRPSTYVWCVRSFCEKVVAVVAITAKAADLGAGICLLQVAHRGPRSLAGSRRGGVIVSPSLGITVAIGVDAENNDKKDIALYQVDNLFKRLIISRSLVKNLWFSVLPNDYLDIGEMHNAVFFVHSQRGYLKITMIHKSVWHCQRSYLKTKRLSSLVLISKWPCPKE